MALLSPSTVFAPGIKPRKSEIIQLLDALRDAGVNIIAKALKSDLLLVVPDAEGDLSPLGYVFDDPVAANNGIYSYDTSWERMRGFPDTLSVLEGVGGTANAITASTKTGIDPSEVIALVLQVAATNSGSVTLALNGAAAKPVLDFGGTALAPGAVVAGQIIMLVDNGDEYRLLSPALAVAAFDHKGTWAAPTAYTEGQVVTGSDGNWYQLKVPAATGDDPVSGGSGDWLQILAGAAVSDRSLGEIKLTKRLSARVGALFDTVADLVADATLSYTDIDPGDIVEAQGFRYEVAASDATDEHVETAGGVKLYVLPDSQGAYNVVAFGVRDDGTDSTTELTMAIVTSDVPHVHFPPGRFVWSADIVRETSVRITGSGRATVLAPADGYQIKVLGSLTALPDLGGDVTKGEYSFDFASAPDLDQLDVFVLYNPTDGSFTGSRTYYRDGQFCQAAAVSGSTVQIFGQLDDEFAAADMDVYRLDGPSCTFENLTVEQTGSTEALRAELCKGVLFKNVGGTFSGDSGVTINRCYDWEIDGGAIEGAPDAGGTNYSYVIANSQKGIVRGSVLGATRHAVTIGGGDAVGCVPNRHILVIGCVLDNWGRGTGGAADTHGNCASVTFDGCILRNQLSIGGLDCTYRNCTIYGAPKDHPSVSSGACIYGSEIAGGTYLIENCKFVTMGDLVAHGLIHIAPNANMREDLHVVVNNITVEAPNAATSGIVVWLNANGANKKVNATIDGVSGTASALSAVLYARDIDGGALPSDFLIVEGVKVQVASGNPYLIYPDASIASVPTREMEQRGKIVHTSTAAVVNAAADTSFKYRYSRIPAAVVGIGTGNGAVATDGLVAGKIPSPIVYSIDRDSIRPGMVSTDGAAFTAGVSVAMTWSARVFEV